MLKPDGHRPGEMVLAPHRWMELDDVPRPIADSPIAAPVASPWSGWLSRLERRSRARSDEQLVLTLDVARCTLALATVRRTRSGAWGRPAPMARGRVAAAATLAVDDAALLDAVESIPWSEAGTLFIVGRVGARALGSALDSGKLHTRDGASLGRGEVRSGALGWRFDGQYQRPQIEVNDPRDGNERSLVIASTPPHYYDASRGTVGEVAVPGVSPQVVATWLAGPAVSIARAEKLAEHMATASPHLPRPIMVEHIGGSPTPRITLRERPALPGAGPTRVAELSFRYGPVTVRGHGLGEETVSLGPVRRAVVRRDFDAESAAREALSARGFREVPPDFHAHWEGQIEHWTMRTEQDWLGFLLDGHRLLIDSGFDLEIDPSFSLKLIEVDDWYTELETSDRDWFGLELGVVVDGERVSLLEPLLAALKDRGGAEQAMFVALPKGGHVGVPRERIAPLLDLLFELSTEPDDAKPKLSRVRAMDLAAMVRSERGALAAMRALRDELTSGAAQAPELPKAFRADLRPYQRAGLGWLWRLHCAGLGAVLADDMGLGKTVQIIALLCILRERDDRRPSLVVAPTSVLVSWADQLAAFAPHLDVVVWHGPSRCAERARIASADVVLTTYGLLHRDGDELVKQPWDLCVLDEAQTIKNAKTVFWEQARRLDARQRVAITGTPMENHLGELWSIVSFAIPGALGSERTFRAVYRTPIEKHRDIERLAALRRRLAPVLLRRTKDEVASDLPQKTIIEHVIELEGDQRDMYEAVRQATVKAVREAIAERGFARSRIIVLDALLKLRQICCDPRLLKAKVARRATGSAKLDAFMELVRALVGEGRRILVFSQFVEMLELIAARLDEVRVPFLTLTGATANRRVVVDMFRMGTVPVFLISLKAGGTGLNLVEADTVIHYDPWWNPAVEAQATDRAHRIGQTKPVFVHKLVTRSTVEQKIVELQRSKAELARGLLEGAFDAPQLDQATVDALLEPLPR